MDPQDLSQLRREISQIQVKLNQISHILDLSKEVDSPTKVQIQRSEESMRQHMQLSQRQKTIEYIYNDISVIMTLIEDCYESFLGILQLNKAMI